MERMVKVTNLSSARVTYNLPNLSVVRMFLPGVTIEIPFDEIRQSLYEYGIRSMYSDGTLYVADEKAAVELGLRVGQGIVEADPVTPQEILTKLKTSGSVALRKFFESASAVTKETAGKLAVENRIVDPAKVKVIEEFTGVNVINALQRQEEMKAPAKQEE